jgi:integrase
VAPISVPRVGASGTCTTRRTEAALPYARHLATSQHPRRARSWSASRTEQERKLSPRRRTIAQFGPRRGRVRVLLDTGGELVRVQWYDDGVRRVRSWSNTSEGRAEAKAWARGFAETRAVGPRPATPRLPLRELWNRYVEAEFPHLRPKTQSNYTEHWNRWELFLGRNFTAEEARLGDVDHFRAALERQNYALSQIHKGISVVKTVYNWAQRRELLGINRLALYRFKVAKDLRPEPPAEYTSEERQAILDALHHDRHTEWRPWAAVTIAAYQGARENAILHLQWEDIDFDRGEIAWRARWDKTGRERVQPLTDGARVAAVVARQWREHDRYAGPWVLYTSHRRRWTQADGDTAWTAQALWLALTKAERRAGVSHIENRAMHGFRRAVAGDVLDLTRDMKLALDWIGDVDLGMARRYLRPRNPRLEEAATAVDRLLGEIGHRNRHVTVTEPERLGTVEAESVGELELVELGREDSNLQLPG